MDPCKTHGVLRWLALMTSNPQAACAFYAKPLGWKIETMDMGIGRIAAIQAAQGAASCAVSYGM